MRNMLLEVVVGLTRVSSELGVESILVKCPDYLSFLCSPQRTSRSASTTDRFSSLCQQTHTSGHCPELTAVGEGPNVDWMINVNAFDRVNVQVHSSESSNLTTIRDRFREWIKTNWNKEQAESTLDLHLLCTVFAAAARQTPSYLRDATMNTMAVFDAPAVEMVWLQAQLVFDRTLLLSKIAVTSHDHALSWHRHMLSTIVFHWSHLSVCMGVSC